MRLITRIYRYILMWWHGVKPDPVPAEEGWEDEDTQPGVAPTHIGYPIEVSNEPRLKAVTVAGRRHSIGSKGWH